jgi:uncharacterized membrane protein YccC
MSRKKHVGSSLSSLFDELDERAELDLLTRKKIIAERLHEAMDQQGMTKKALAEAIARARGSTRAIGRRNRTHVQQEYAPDVVVPQVISLYEEIRRATPRGSR